MTSQRLISDVLSYPRLRSAELNISPEEIYSAASTAQSEILFDCDIIESVSTLTFIANQEVYTSMDAPFLSQIGRVLNPIVMSNGCKIEARSVSYIDGIRSKSAQGMNPQFYYVLKTDPLSIGFWYKPTQVTSVNIRYTRKHTDADDISDSINPLIPSEYRKCLVLGTVANLLEQRDGLENLADRQKILFENEKMKIKIDRTLTNVCVNPISRIA
jgi:hypothetical protein